MHFQAVFSSLRHGTPLAASNDASGSDRLAWIGVYPLDFEKPLTREFLHSQGVELVPLSGRAYRHSNQWAGAAESTTMGPGQDPNKKEEEAG